jgi:hypothetical protein
MVFPVVVFGMMNHELWTIEIMSHKLLLSPRILLAVVFFLAVSQPIAYSQTALSSEFCDAPLVPEWLENKTQFSSGEAITDKTISETGLTIPSLWWAKEQFDPFGGRLINHWLADRNQRRIDMIVNRQLWSLLDYGKRYRLINQFGTVAREYQYDLRVFNQQKKCLATYTCNFSLNPHQCEINFEPASQTGLQVDTLTKNELPDFIEKPITLK